MEHISEQELRILQQAYEEDACQKDLTTHMFPQKTLTMHLILNEDAVLAGLTFLPQILHTYAPTTQIQVYVEDGVFCKKGTYLAQLSGSSHLLLSCERVILNFLQHLSGIATKTARYKQAIAHTTCELLDTRKTIPGMRRFQKYAVHIGGGTNHRMDLHDQIMIKDNHLQAFLDEDLPSLKGYIDTFKVKYPEKRIIIEVDSLSQFALVLPMKPDAILLDNFMPSEVRKAVLQNNNLVYLEASGGITLENIQDYAETGVHGISVGALTHSVEAIDMSMQIEKNHLYLKQGVKNVCSS